MADFGENEEEIDYEKIYNASKTISAVPKLIPNSSNISLPLSISIEISPVLRDLITIIFCY